jgi:hypothetical protein
VAVFGPTAGEDGAVGITKESARAGLFGRNDGTKAPPSGTPGGAGVFGLTVVPGAAGVFGANNHRTRGVGVQGNGPEAGVSGYSNVRGGVGLRAHSDRGDGLQSFAHSESRNAILAQNDATQEPDGGGPPAGNGILATTTVPTAAGVFGANNSSDRGVGVQGNGPEAGLSGFSAKGVGVSGNGRAAGVTGFSKSGPGLRADSTHDDGTQSFAHDPHSNGLLGHNDGTAPSHRSRLPGQKSAPAGNGVFGYTDVPGGSGVCGAISDQNQKGAGVTGIGPIAGHFFGNVIVTGNIECCGADYAEDFDVAEPGAPEPGTVMVLDQDGEALRQSTTAYDARVAGIVCGAGPFRPGIILDRRPSDRDRVPIALMGKVYCKVDASNEPVQVGDVLTTSATPGYAMRATDRERAFGAVIGKALAPLSAGRGLVPVLVSLQ